MPENPFGPMNTLEGMEQFYRLVVDRKFDPDFIGVAPSTLEILEASEFLKNLDRYLTGKVSDRYLSATRSAADGWYTPICLADDRSFLGITPEGTPVLQLESSTESVKSRWAELEKRFSQV